MSAPRSAVAAARYGAVLLACAFLLAGCSIKKLAIKNLGDALAGNGGTFASDDDPELIQAALPFSLKLIESLVAESPRHRGLLQAAASGFTQYAYAFVQQEADEREDADLAAASALRDRARRLYLRARGYGLRGLALSERNFEAKLRRDAPQAVGALSARDVPLMFWTAAAWGAAISVSKDNPELISDQKFVEALLDRACELRPDFDEGALATLLISLEMVRQGVPGEPAARARKHFERALALGQGRQASPLVAFAESVCVETQDRAGFERWLKQALAINPDAVPATRLANLIAQRRARWLLGRAEELFFTAK